MQTPFTFPAAEVTIGFVDDAIVASEPINFTVSVVLFQNILDPGTEISLSLMGRDGVATGIHIMTLYYHAPSLASSPDHSQFAHRSILVCNNIENWELLWIMLICSYSNVFYLYTHRC